MIFARNCLLLACLAFAGLGWARFALAIGHSTRVVYREELLDAIEQTHAKFLRRLGVAISTPNEDLTIVTDFLDENRAIAALAVAKELSGDVLVVESHFELLHDMFERFSNFGLLPTELFAYHDLSDFLYRDYVDTLKVSADVLGKSEDLILHYRSDIDEKIYSYFHTNTHIKKNLADLMVLEGEHSVFERHVLHYAFSMLSQSAFEEVPARDRWMSGFSALVISDVQPTDVSLTARLYDTYLSWIAGSANDYLPDSKKLPLKRIRPHDWAFLMTAALQKIASERAEYPEQSKRAVSLITSIRKKSTGSIWLILDGAYKAYAKPKTRACESFLSRLLRRRQKPHG